MSVFTTLVAEGELTIVAPNGRREVCRYRGGYIAHPEFTRVALDVDSPTFGQRTFENGDLFWALIDFRKLVEPKGWRVLCNGSRRDAWPSGMLAQMLAGASVYLLSRPDAERCYERLNTFDPADPRDVASVEEQIAWRDQFFASRRRRK
jgi:hypothetical protein